MKQILNWMMAAVALMTATNVSAQRIQVTDKEGNAIPMVSVLADDGTFIGITDIDGVLSDVKGAQVATFTHVAYKSKKANVGQGGMITLDDADFDLPEIVVTPKPLVYVQTYYRIFYLADYPDGDKDDVCYYRAGVLNNSYNRKTKDVSSDEDHISGANMGALKSVLNMIIGLYIKPLASLRVSKMESRLKNAYKEINLEFVPDGSGRQLIKDTLGLVGSIVDYPEKGERWYSYEQHTLSRHLIQITGSDKKKAKTEKRDERQKNREDQDFTVYHIDAEGNYSPEDFVMSQSATSYDSEKYGQTVPVNILVQVFNVERAYVTKEELKEIKKENKMKMTYKNILDFEQSKKIAPLPEVFMNRINDFMKQE